MLIVGNLTAGKFGYEMCEKNNVTIYLFFDVIIVICYVLSHAYYI